MSESTARSASVRIPRASARLDASVIVPTHARPGRLARLLASLERQGLPPERFEVIVVDDGSPDERRPSDAAFGANARLLRQRRQGPAAARNAGAAVAAGRMLAFIDDDCIADPRWLAALLATHDARPRELLGGTTENGRPDNPFSAVAESLLVFLDEDELGAGRPLSFVASNNAACARDAFARLGGFDTSYPLAAGEDRAFCRSWRRSVGPLSRVADARVQHCHAHDLRSFWRQQRNYGRGAALFHAASAPTTAPAATPRVPRLPREPAFYVRLLTHGLARRELPWSRRLGTLPIVALSQLAIASGLRAERRTLRTRGEACRPPP